MAWRRIEQRIKGTFVLLIVVDSSGVIAAGAAAPPFDVDTNRSVL